jgi:hypothetical protein
MRVFGGGRRQMRRFVIAGSVLALSASIAAVALAGRSGPHQRSLATRFVHTSPLTPYLPAVRARVVGGDAIERSAAAQTVRAFGPANRVLRIEFVSPPADFGLPATALWVRVDVAAPDRPGAAFSTWQALLAVSAIADANRSAGAAPIAGKTVRLVFPSGTMVDAGSTVDGPLPTPGDAAPGSAAALGAAIAAEARQEHLQVTEQGSFDIGGRPAVFATLITDDPVGFGQASGTKMFALQRAIFNAPSAAAGSYIEVRDSAGGVVEIGGSASRLQQGVGWTNPALLTPLR